MNRICLIGRLVRDVELKTTQSGKSVGEATLAVDKRLKPQDGSAACDFIRVKLWGQQAEFLSNYGGKGRLCAVEGRVETRKYTDKDGNNREISEVVADSVSLLDRPKDDAPRAATAPTAQANDEDFDPFA